MSDRTDKLELEFEFTKSPTNEANLLNIGVIALRLPVLYGAPSDGVDGYAARMDEISASVAVGKYCDLMYDTKAASVL